MRIQPGLENNPYRYLLAPYDPENLDPCITPKAIQYIESRQPGLTDRAIAKLDDIEWFTFHRQLKTLTQFSVPGLRPLKNAEVRYVKRFNTEGYWEMMNRFFSHIPPYFPKELSHKCLAPAYRLTCPNGKKATLGMDRSDCGGLEFGYPPPLYPNLTYTSITSGDGGRLQQAEYNGGVGAFTLPANPVLSEFVVFSSPYNVELIGEVANQDLHGLSTPDLLIVTHPDFISEAERLASHRSTNNGVSVAVVTTEQIYNEFSSGKQDVTAITLYEGKQQRVIVLRGKMKWAC